MDWATLIESSRFAYSFTSTAHKSRDGPYRCGPVAVLQLFAHERKVDAFFDEPQPQMSLRNLIFQAEVVEQRFRAEMVPYRGSATSRI